MRGTAVKTAEQSKDNAGQPARLVVTDDGGTLIPVVAYVEAERVAVARLTAQAALVLATELVDAARRRWPAG